MIQDVASDDLIQKLFFEFWNEDTERGLPIVFAKSSLFTARNKRVPRQNYKKKELFSVSQGSSILYTGPELRSDSDELVWLQILNYAMRSRNGALAQFSQYQLCKDLGWKINGQYYELIKDCLVRLQANVMHIQSSKTGTLRHLSLIENVEFPNVDDAHNFVFAGVNPKVVQLFAGQQYIRVYWEKYRALRPIARRLFDYFASHSTPHPLRLDTLQKMCDSDCSTTWKWKQQVAKACDELISKELVNNAWIAENKVHCQRSPLG